MAIPGTQQVTAKIAPSALTDVYPTHDETFGMGGYQSAADSPARDAITVERRKEGMLVTTLDTGECWQLQSDLVTWALFQPGGVAGAITLTGDVTGTGTGTIPTTLATVATPATKGTVSRSATITINAKGLTTSLTDAPILIAQSAVTGLTAALALKEDKANKGIANGYVPLNGANMIDPAYYISGTGLVPKGNWNVATNTPAVADGTGSLGWWYVVTNSANPTTRNLGSGNIDFYDGDWVIHNGAIYVKNGNGVPAVTGITTINTDSGSLTGASVALNSTAQIAPTADRQYQTALQKAIQDAAVIAGANAVNRYALKSEVVTVGNQFWTPEEYATVLGYVLGTGLSQTGVSYGKSTPQFQADFPLVPNLQNTDQVDYAALYQASMMMANGGKQNRMDLGCYGARNYVVNKSINIPNVTSKANIQYIYELNGCVIDSISTTQDIFRSLPVSQADAANFANAGVIMRNGALRNQSAVVKGSGTALIRLGARAISLSNINFNGGDTCLDLQFCLQGDVRRCNTSGQKTTGYHFGMGTWAGASTSNSAPNGMYVEDCRVQTERFTDYGYHFEVGSDITMINNVSESFDIDQLDLGNQEKCSIFYDSLGASTTKGTFQIYGHHCENACSDAQIKIKGKEGVFHMADISNQFQGLYTNGCRNMVSLNTYGGFLYFDMARFAHWTPNMQFFLQTNTCVPFFYLPWSATVATMSVPGLWSGVFPGAAQINKFIYP